jgi:hypothetical protein
MQRDVAQAPVFAQAVEEVRGGRRRPEQPRLRLDQRGGGGEAVEIVQRAARGDRADLGGARRVRAARRPGQRARAGPTASASSTCRPSAPRASACTSSGTRTPAVNRPWLGRWVSP